MSEVDRVLAEAAERIRREAYAQGWRDALAAVSKAVAETQPEDVAAPFDPGTPDPAPRLANSPNSSSLPTVGTTPHYVYQAVKKRPGMTGLDVIAAVRADGHTAVADNQIRTALSRLEKRNLIANRHKKWFPQ